LKQLQYLDTTMNPHESVIFMGLLSKINGILLKPITFDQNNQNILSVISIIIPTYNESKNIKNLMLFFGSLDKSTFEVIISDSPESSDDTETIVRKYNHIYIKSPRAGRACQMNEGAMLATGSIFCFLHADVLPPQTFVQDIKDALTDEKQFGFFAYNFQPTSTLLNINSKFTARDGIFAGGGDQIHFMTASLFKEMNGYDSRFCIMEDFDFVRRLRNTNKPIEIVQNRATVSSRKYTNNSYLKVNLLNLLAFLMFTWRSNPVFIRRLYYKFLN
jgi:rSAM/selenodomain-associated transferase 2